MIIEGIPVEDLERACNILFNSTKLSRKTLQKFYRALIYATPSAERRLSEAGIRGARAGKKLAKRFK